MGTSLSVFISINVIKMTDIVIITIIYLSA